MTSTVLEFVKLLTNLKKMTDNPKNSALEFFKQGYNCAESVLLELAKVWNLPSEVVPRAATSFGGGIGGSGYICGAIAGAGIALGLYRGRNNVSDAAENERKKKIYLTMSKLITAFKEKYGCCNCRELTNCDLSDPKQMQEFKDSGKHDEICPPIVEFVAQWVSNKVDY